MQSSLIGKIEKSRRYATEPQRIKFVEFKVNFRGEHDTHAVSYGQGKWHCTCSFFASWGTCSHTMAMQRVFRDNLPEEAITDPAVLMFGQ